MKNLIKTDFDKFYEELSKLNEDLNNFEIPYDEIRSHERDDNWSLWSTIKGICNTLRRQFYARYGKSASNWGYQFQLMYNAYKTETKTLDILNNQADIIIKINEELKNRNMPQIYGEYEFNSEPSSHEALSIAWESTTDIFYDIQAKGNLSDDRVNSVEVKASNDYDKADHFHNAQLVFIYNLSKDKFIIKYKTAEGKYENLGLEFNANVQKECISAQPIPARLKFMPFSDTKGAQAAEVESSEE